MSRLEALVFANRLGQQLVGVLHHGTGPGPHPCLVVCHGFAGSKVGSSRRFVAFAHQAAAHHFAVFRFDFAGSGDSEGELSELTLDQQLDDLRAAIDAVSGVGTVDCNRIGVVGHCLGAVAAIRAAARDRRIGRVVAWAPFTDLPGTLRRLIGAETFALVAGGETVDFLYNNQLYQCGPRLLAEASDFDLVQELADLHQPLLILHGSEDATVPLGEVQQLQAAATPGDVQLQVLVGAHHSFPYHQEELFDATVRWFDNW